MSSNNATKDMSSMAQSPNYHDNRKLQSNDLSQQWPFNNNNRSSQQLPMNTFNDPHNNDVPRQRSAKTSRRPSRTPSCRGTMASHTSVERYALPSDCEDDAPRKLINEPTPEQNEQETSQNNYTEEPKRKSGFTNNRIDSFIGETSFHGFDQVWNAESRFPRIFWSITLIIVLGISFYQLRNLFAYFMDNPTLTSISMVYPDEGITFPELTLCLLSRFNQTKVLEKYRKLNLTTRTAEFSTSSFISAYSTALMDIGYFTPGVDVNNADNLPMLKATWRALQNDLFAQTNGASTLNFLQDNTFDCNAMFRACWIENGDMFNCCDPNNTIYARSYLIHSGVCFDLAPKFKQQLPGPVGGVGFAFMYPNEHILKTAYNAYDEHAVHLFMSPVDAALEKKPVAVSVGSHAHVSLTATRTTRQTVDELGRSICTQPILKYFNEYSYPKCQIECVVNTFVNVCNCIGVMTVLDNPSDIQICTPEQALDCYNKLVMNGKDTLKKSLTDCRQMNCTEACDYWTYQSSLTVGKVFNPRIKDKMKEYWRLPSDNNPSQSLIVGDIYFGDIQYTLIEEKSALSIEAFVSSIGGAMGLWIGASIVSWIHLLYWCCSFCFNSQSPARQRLRQSCTDRRRRKVLSNRPTVKYEVAVGPNEPMGDEYGSEDSEMAPCTPINPNMLGVESANIERIHD